MASTYSQLDINWCSKEYFLQEDICRFCWSQGAHTELHSNCKTESEMQNQLVNKIQNYLNIDLFQENTEKYPKKVCEKCLSKIEEFCIFKQFCVESERKLREIFSRDEEVVSNNIYEASIELMEENGEDYLNVPSYSLYTLIDTLKQGSNQLNPLETSKSRKTRKKSKIESKGSNTDNKRTNIIKETNINLPSMDINLQGINIVPKKSDPVGNILDSKRNNIELLGSNVELPGSNIEPPESNIEPLGSSIEPLGSNIEPLGSNTEVGFNKDPENLNKTWKKTLDPIKTIRKKIKRSKSPSTKIVYKHKRSETYCNICCTDLNDVKLLTQHKSEAHGVESNGEFKCFGCEKKFHSRKARMGHEMKFCKGLLQGYKCNICDRYLPKRRLYEAHMKDHRSNKVIELPEDLFKCAICDNSFKTKDSLKLHKKEHVKEKNYICETCGRAFTRADYLLKHSLMHTGERRHACPHCDFRSTQKTTLNIHIRRHTGERPYRCDVCPQRCVSSSNLQAHRRRHLGLNSFECHICSKRFGYKLSLAEHIESVHEQSPSHPCSHCGAHYTRARGLRRHLRLKHGVFLQNQRDSITNKNHKDPNLKIEQGGLNSERIYIQNQGDSITNGNQKDSITVEQGGLNTELEKVKEVSYGIYIQNQRDSIPNKNQKDSVTVEQGGLNTELEKVINQKDSNLEIDEGFKALEKSSLPSSDAKDLDLQHFYVKIGDEEKYLCVPKTAPYEIVVIGEQ